MAVFLEAVSHDEGFKPSDFGVNLSSADALSRLAKTYGF